MTSLHSEPWVPNVVSGIWAPLIIKRDVSEEERDSHGRWATDGDSSTETTKPTSSRTSPATQKLVEKVKNQLAEAAQQRARISVRPDTDTNSRVYRNADKIAKELGYKSVSDYRKQEAQRLQNFVDTHQLIVRVPNVSSLEKIIGEGRLRNGFQSGESKRNYMGSKDGQLFRKQGEQKVLGVPIDATPGQRPVYGYIGSTTPVDISQSFGDEDLLNMYGRVEIQLNDAVKERTSVILGDSLDVHAGSFGVSSFDQTIVPSMANDIQPESVPLPYYGGDEDPHNVLKDILNWGNDSKEPIGRVTGAYRQYIEAQIYGKITTKDIASINFKSEGLPNYARLTYSTPHFQSLIAQLDSLNIPWTIDNAKVSYDEALTGLADPDREAYFEQKRGEQEIAANRARREAASKLFKYDDAESRDYHGRWTKEDSDGGHIGSEGTDFRPITPEISGWRLRTPSYGDSSTGELSAYAKLSGKEKQEYEQRLERIQEEVKRNQKEYAQQQQIKEFNEMYTNGTLNEKTGSNLTNEQWTQLRDETRSGAPISPELLSLAEKEVAQEFARGKAPEGVDLSTYEYRDKMLLLGQALVRNGMLPSDYPNGTLPPNFTQDVLGARSPSNPYSAGNEFSDFRMGLSSKQLSSFRAGLASEMQDSTPKIRIASSGLARVLTDGEFKSGSEVQKTGAPTSANGRTVADYISTREQYENYRLNLPQDASPSQRPVYGFMEKNGESDAITPSDIQSGSQLINELLAGLTSGTSLSYLQEQAQQENKMQDYYTRQVAKYEDAVKNPQNYLIIDGSYREDGHKVSSYGLVSKEEFGQRVAKAQEIIANGKPRYGSATAKAEYKRAEITMKNPVYALADASGKINSDLLSILAQQEYSATAYYGDAKVTLNSSILSSATVTNGDSADSWWTHAIPASMAQSGDSRLGGAGMFLGISGRREDGITGPYLELQMYQHPAVKDIASVEFTGKTPSSSLTKQLDALGIPYTVNAPKMSLGKMKMSASDFLPATTTKSFVAKYDESEERDNHGRWTKEGDGESSSERFTIGSLNYDNIAPGLEKMYADAGLQRATDAQWKSVADAVNNGKVVDPKAWEAVRNEMQTLQKASERVGAEYKFEQKWVDRKYDENDKYIPGHFEVISDSLTPRLYEEQRVPASSNGVKDLLYVLERTRPEEEGGGIGTKLTQDQIDNVKEFGARLNLASYYALFGSMAPSDYPSGNLPYLSAYNPDGTKTEQADVYEKFKTFFGATSYGYHSDATGILQSSSMQITSEQAQQIRDAYAEILKNSTPVVMVDSSIIEKMLKGAALGNMFTTNKTGSGSGATETYMFARKNSEALIMGYSPKSTGEQRPVYGVMTPNKEVGGYTKTNENGIDMALASSVGISSLYRVYDENGQFEFATASTFQEMIDAEKESDLRYAQEIKDILANNPERAANYPEQYNEARIARLLNHDGLNKKLAEIQDIKDNPQNYIAVAGRTLNWDRNKWSDKYEIRSKQSIEDEIAKAKEYIESHPYARGDAKTSIRDYIGTLKSYKMYELAQPDGSLNKDIVAWVHTQSNGDTAQYGDSSIILKDSMLQNATLTIGDSLDSKPVIAIPYTLAASADPRAPIPLSSDYSSPGMPVLEGKPPSTGMYYEMQVGGHNPTLDDVAKIIFTNGQPAPAVQKKLDAAGVAYEVAYPNFNPKNFTKVDMSRVPEPRK